MGTVKLDISAIVVGFNEAHLLERCLESIQFCKEINYFDLQSSDNSIAIAKQYGANIMIHERVPGCEWIHAKYATKTKYNWVLITDPDEVVDIELAGQLVNSFSKNIIDESIGGIYVPCLFYFKKYCLKGTPWGGTNKRVLVVHNKRFSFSANVHVGRHLKEGYKMLDIKFNGKNCIHHYWMQDWNKLIEKHKRYLKNEGWARYNIGERSKLSRVLFKPFNSFWFSFMRKKGYKDGLLGLSLSFFWAWYQTNAELTLLKFQKKMAKP